MHRVHNLLKMLECFPVPKMFFLILDLYCLFSFTIHQGQSLTWKRNKIPTPKQSEEMSPLKPLLPYLSPLQSCRSIQCSSANSLYPQLEVNRESAAQGLPDAKIHYSPDLWQAPWESNLAFQMNGRSGKRGACPSGEVIKSLQIGAGAAEGSSDPAFPSKTLLVLPHGQHSVKKYPKNTFLSMNLQACTEKLMIIKCQCKPRFYQPSQLLHMEQTTLQS